MKYSLQNTLPNPQETLRDFLYHAIFVPSGESPPNRMILDSPELACYYREWGNKEDRALFAVQDKSALGACWSRCFPAETTGYGTVAPEIPELSISVLPESRGLGIGTNLLSHFLNQLKSEFDAVSLSVSRDNPALRLYQRFGFLPYHAEEQSLILIKRF